MPSYALQFPKLSLQQMWNATISSFLVFNLLTFLKLMELYLPLSNPQELCLPGHIFKLAIFISYPLINSTTSHYLALHLCYINLILEATCIFPIFCRLPWKIEPFPGVPGLTNITSMNLEPYRKGNASDVGIFEGAGKERVKNPHTASLLLVLS